MGCHNSKQQVSQLSTIEFSIELQYLHSRDPGKILTTSSFHSNSSVFFMREFTSPSKQQHKDLRQRLVRYESLVSSQTDICELTKILKVKESVINGMICNGIYKNYLLFEHSNFSLQDEICARAVIKKLFDKNQLWNIVKTGLAALEIVNSVELFSNADETMSKSGFSRNFKDLYYRQLFINPQRILILDQGLIKVMDPLTLSFQDRHIRMKNFNYSPQKISDFTFVDDEKSAIFEFGMTCLHAATLESCFDVYDGYQIDHNKIFQKLQLVKAYYQDYWLVQILAKMVQIKRCKRFRIKEAKQLVSWATSFQLTLNGSSSPQSEQINKQHLQSKTAITSIPVTDCNILRRPVQAKNHDKLLENLQWVKYSRALKSMHLNEDKLPHKLSQFQSMETRKEAPQNVTSNGKTSLEQNSSLIVFSNDSHPNLNQEGYKVNNNMFGSSLRSNSQLQGSYNYCQKMVPITADTKKPKQLYNEIGYSKRQSLKIVDINILTTESEGNKENLFGQRRVRKNQYLYTDPKLLEIVGITKNLSPHANSTKADNELTRNFQIFNKTKFVKHKNMLQSTEDKDTSNLNSSYQSGHRNLKLSINQFIFQDHSKEKIMKQSEIQRNVNVTEEQRVLTEFTFKNCMDFSQIHIPTVKDQQSSHQNCTSARGKESDNKNRKKITLNSKKSSGRDQDQGKNQCIALSLQKQSSNFTKCSKDKLKVT